MSPERKQKNDLKPGLGQIGPYLGVGLEFAVSLLLFIFLGRYLDKLLGTEPWLFISGSALGFIVGFYSLVKTLDSLSRRKKNSG